MSDRWIGNQGADISSSKVELGKLLSKLRDGVNHCSAKRGNLVCILDRLHDLGYASKHLHRDVVEGKAVLVPFETFEEEMARKHEQEELMRQSEQLREQLERNIQQLEETNEL
jgi:hypothetical protein